MRIRVFFIFSSRCLNCCCCFLLIFKFGNFFFYCSFFKDYTISKFSIMFKSFSSSFFLCLHFLLVLFSVHTNHIILLNHQASFIVHNKQLPNLITQSEFLVQRPCHIVNDCFIKNQMVLHSRSISNKLVHPTFIICNVAHITLL